MTPKQYGQLAEWAAEGRLEAKSGSGWDMSPLPHPESSKVLGFSNYQRRPDAPKMPDEIWVSGDRANATRTAFTAFTVKGEAEPNHDDPIRYIRAGEVIDGDRLEYHGFSTTNWTLASGFVFRFKGGAA